MSNHHHPHHHSHHPHHPHHPHQSNLDFSSEDIESFLGGVLSRHATEEYDVATTTTTAADDNDGPFNAVAEEQKAAVRTERKRCREKQRRSDVNRQFTELSNALRKVETESSDWARHTYTSTTNRADLIARSIYILNSIHDSNESRKRRVIELERDLEQAKKAGEEAAAKLKEQMMAPQQMGGGRMVMMVPMMIGGDSAPAPAMPYGQMPYFMPPQGAGDGGPSMPPQPVPLPAYMMQHMMVQAAQQQQSMMGQGQPAPMSVVVGPTGGGDIASAGDGKKKAATEDSITNNVAHLA